MFYYNLTAIKVLGISLLIVQCKTGDNPTAKNKNDKPNIIYMLADDLGYGDLGVYGQTKIETPQQTCKMKLKIIWLSVC